MGVKIMKLIVDNFAKRFSHWDITLPGEDIRNRRSGFIKDAGWFIQYCFGKDESGEYLDYYAAHRMTEDSHVRLYADGRIESLPALYGFMIRSKDDPERDKRLVNEHNEHNEKVREMLNEKGFR